MGSWLFSSNPCNCSSCELGTHPGAHRLVYVRRPNELNAFPNAVLSAPDSVRCKPPPTPLHRIRFSLHRNALRCTETRFGDPGGGANACRLAAIGDLRPNDRERPRVLPRQITLATAIPPVRIGLKPPYRSHGRKTIACRASHRHADSVLSL